MVAIWPVLVLTTLCLGTRAQSDTLPPPSPCPSVYGYGWTASGGWHGVISIIPPVRFSEIQLTVRLNLPYFRPEAGVGRIEIKGGQYAVQQISNKAIRGERQKIQYQVIFPPFKELPRIAGVTINGKNFCPVTQTFSDTRGTIELKYSLKSGLNIPMAAGIEFTAGSETAISTTTKRPDIIIVEIPTGDEATTKTTPSAIGDDVIIFTIEHNQSHLSGVDRPQNVGNGPQNGGNGPQNGVNRPQNGGNWPQNGGNGPQNGVNRPQHGGNGSQNGVNGPQNGGNGPQNGGNGPQNGVNGPQNGGNGPQNGGNGPQNVGNGPQNVGNGADSSTENGMILRLLEAISKGETVASNRIENLLEHLLLITKQRYLLEMQRLKIERERLKLDVRG